MSRVCEPLDLQDLAILVALEALLLGPSLLLADLPRGEYIPEDVEGL